MLGIVDQSVATGEGADGHENEFKEVADEIEQLQKRIKAIRDSMSGDGATEKRLAEIQNIIEERKQHENQYDDSIVRQMIECIKVYSDGRLEVIFGGSYTVEEHI